jgi:hypothetical protein
MMSVERVCAGTCGYQVAVGNDVRSAVERMTPQACPRCGGDLAVPGSDEA